jgi:hypothetical protein
VVAASDRATVAFSLSGGNRHDAPEGELLLGCFERLPEQLFILMDRAHESGRMRRKAAGMGFVPVVPPKRNRREPWEYDKERYRKRNEVGRFFLRLKRFRKIFTGMTSWTLSLLGSSTLLWLPMQLLV